VSKASEEVNERVMSVVLDEHKLLEHLAALKKFLLLGQGDFVSALLDAVGPELSKRADAVYRHNLIGVLDTALRGTNAQ
jgi:gamma-tubulin complex component 3